MQLHQTQDSTSATGHWSSPYPNLPPPVDVRLVTLPPHDCSYLPGRAATSRAFYADRLAPELYHDFMDAGFRRSGKIVYQPICQGCRRCLPLRVLVNEFQPGKSQRRCTRRNADLVISQGEPALTEEKFNLYSRYVTKWHQSVPRPDDDVNNLETFEAFLYDSPVDSLEFTYRTPAGDLLAVGICDVSRRSLSSVYFYFDPAESKRGLGTLGVLHELAIARAMSIPFYYLGYWVRGCASMEYKANFRPFQFLSPDGQWCDGSTKLDIMLD